MITVTAGQSLRAAILNAPITETLISVEAGAVFNEVIELPARERTAPLVIQSSRINELPEGKRVSSTDSAKLFKIVPPVNADPQRAIITQPGAHHYSFLGMEVTHDPSKDWHTLISLGDSAQRTLEEIPYSLIFDRCYIHGHPDRSSVRAIALNSASTSILNSHISDIHSNDVDSQAICGWAGPGPFRIENCYLEAAGENVMFGGADPLIAGLIPSDIIIRRCYFFKPLTWKVDDPSYAGRKWITKNLLETKNARRVIVDGCVFENCWADAQVGFAILLKSNNQESTAPWSVTEDLTFTNNSILNSEHGVNILGTEVPPKVSDVTKRLKLINNYWQVRKIWLQITNGGEDIELSHNTFFSEWGSTGIFGDTGEPTVKGFVLNNNLGTRSGYGLKGDGMAEGTPTLNTWTPNWTMAGNVLATQNAQDPISSHPYPAGNSFPASLSEVGFIDLTNGNYRLRADSPYKGKATDGKDPGVDWDALTAAQQLPPPPVNIAPTVVLTSPVAGTVVSGQVSVTVTVTGTDIDAAYLLVDDIVAGSSPTAPYSLSLDTTKLADGNHTIWVRVWNKTGQAGDSARVPIVVKNTPSPKPCSITAPSSVTIPRNSSGVIAVQLNDLTGPVTVNVVGSDGQVIVTPLSWNAGPTSTVKQFQVRTKNKKQVREIQFRSSCGVAIVRINVI